MKRLRWMASSATLLLLACGGGNDAAPPPATGPAVIAFRADQATYLMGERARLTPVFQGGAGRIEPDIGPVTSGVAVTTAVLDGDVTYRLIVEAAGRPASVRALTLPVEHRDRFVPSGAFQSRYHAAVELADGSVLVVGGDRGDNVLSDSIDRFDPDTRQFTRVGTLATGRAFAVPVVLSDGAVLITGGDTNAASGVTYELFDPRTGRLTAAGVPFTNRRGHTATRLLDGRVLIAGGFEEATAELWDPATRSARPVAARMSNPRENHTATLLADGRVLIVGGFTMTGRYWLAEIFDPRTEQFTPIGAPSFTPQVDALGLHFAHRLSDGTVLVVGGERFNPAVDSAARPTGSVWRFDPATSTFSAQPGLLAPRTLFGAAVLSDDRLLVFGGATADTPSLASGELYRAGRPAAPTATLDVGRTFHSVSRLPGGRLLVLGGEVPDGSFATSVLIYE